jgi:hypothetical protein
MAVYLKFLPILRVRIDKETVVGLVIKGLLPERLV